MDRRLPLLLIGAALVAGCLDEGPPPTGSHLFHGLNLDSPSFMQVGPDLFVRFRERIASGTSEKGGVYHLWISSFDGTIQRKVVTNWSDRWPELGSAGGRYYMVEERSIPSGAGKAVVGTWLRLGPTLDEEARIEEVSSASPFSAPLSWVVDSPQPGQWCLGFPGRHDECPQALFERPPPVGSGAATLYLWDGANQIPIGQGAGGFQTQMMGDGSIYCILGDQRILSRFIRPANKLDSLRANVSTFQVRWDQRYVALSVTDDNKSRTVIRDLQSGAEVVPARPNPSGWSGFDGNKFKYTQNATSTAPAELHELNLDNGEDTFVTLPPPLINQVAAIARPNSDETLRIDSNGRGVFTGQNDYIGRRTIMGPLLVPNFPSKDDGSFLIYVERAASTLYDPNPAGALMFQDAELAQPPVMVSPPGLLLGVTYQVPYFFTGGGQVLAFWAHFGRAASDLYFADYQPGVLPTNLRLIARSIMSVSVSSHNLFGIVNVSQQDDVGDLVYRDLDLGTETRYAQAVAEADEHAGSDLSTSWTVYNVRGRADSDRSGIWITTLAPAVPPDGGTN
jgi:hypothetical protein